MKKLVKIILGGLLLLIIAAAIAWFGFLRPEPPPISDTDRAQIRIMPLPSKLELRNGHFVVDADFGYSITGVSSPKIEDALDRFFSRLGQSASLKLSKKEGNALTIACKRENGQYPSLSDDESYVLTVRGSHIELSANSDTGVLHGLESLLQLTERQNENLVIPEMDLFDNPRYPWRGIMIDVARHWVPKEVILRNLEAMAMLKMNVLHLHLSEYQGFRVESKKYPKLHEMGSQGNYFSQEDIREILKHAADRGIRIVPEFDVPGHSTSWFIGYPELASAPGPYQLDSIFGILDPVMDPTKESTYAFLDGFVEEMAALFPDEYLHIGGDEVKTAQWEKNPDINSYMAQNGIEDYHQLQAHFNIRMQKILQKHGKKMLGWDEIIHPDLPKEGIAVQSWRNQKSLWDAVKLGNRALLSNGYYLDYKQPAAAHYKVDPLVIPSAVTIDIDSMQWKSWEGKLYVQGNEVPGELYLFGEGKDLRGVTKFMDSFVSFPEATLENGILRFSLETPFGQMDYELNIVEDSLKGSARIAIMNLDYLGKRLGGSDMPHASALPKFEKIVPPTPEEEALILGGEACMWTEMADDRTVESRIWPRAAAVAEKLWSPKELTTNVEDMYRRLISLDTVLEKTGLQHRSNTKALIREMAPEKYWGALETLASVLEEDKFFNRMRIYEPQLYTSTPLNRMVDAARPESYIAYQFNADVDRFLATGDTVLKKHLEYQLRDWSENHTRLIPIFETLGNPIDGKGQEIALGTAPLMERMEQLQEIKPHSQHLSELSKQALAVLNGKGPNLPERDLDTLLARANRAYGGTTLPMVNGVQKLLHSPK